MAELKDWDVAAANNNDASPDGAPEGMAPSGLNDTIREGMAVLARWKGDNDGTLDSGGSSNAYTLSPNGTYSAYARGDTFTFEANHTNTGSASLNVSSLGVKTIKDTAGETLVAGDIQSGGVYTVLYDGTDFLLLSPSYRQAGGVYKSGGGTFTVAASGTTTEVVEVPQTGGAYLVCCYVQGDDMASNLIGVVINGDQNLVSAVATLVSDTYINGTIALQTKANASAFSFAASNARAYQWVLTGDGVAPRTATHRYLRIG